MVVVTDDHGDQGKKRGLDWSEMSWKWPDNEIVSTSLFKVFPWPVFSRDAHPKQLYTLDTTLPWVLGDTPAAKCVGRMVVD